MQYDRFHTLRVLFTFSIFLYVLWCHIYYIMMCLSFLAIKDTYVSFFRMREVSVFHTFCNFLLYILLLQILSKMLDKRLFVVLLLLCCRFIFIIFTSDNSLLFLMELFYFLKKIKVRSVDKINSLMFNGQRLV